MLSLCIRESKRSARKSVSIIMAGTATRRKSDVFGLATLPPLASASHKSRRSEIGLKSSSSSEVEVDLSSSATASEPSLSSNHGSNSSTASLAESCESSLTATPMDDNRFQKNESKNDKQGEDTADVLPSAAVADSTTSGQKSYFLQGIDFESCQDVMSLPDPPDTPADGGGALPLQSTISILRRMSSPLVRPLRDSTNELDDSKVTTRKKKKRTRNTMFEFSSSSSSTCTAAAVTFSSVASNNNEPSVETTTTFSKRRKKRQSIVLPSDAAETLTLEEEHGGGDDDKKDDDDEDSSSPTSRDYIKTFSTFKKESPSTSSWAKDDVARIPSKPNASVLAELRRLVHDYTDLPKAARAGSFEAKTIREMTGYTLTSTAQVDPNDVSSGKSRQEKFAVLQGMENDLRRLDATKQMDAKVVAAVTQCRVQRVRGSGSFRYFLDQTGEPVTPQEYEMRYMLMLETINRIRSEAWSNYFDQLEQDDCWKTITVVSLTLENKDEQSDNASGKDHGSADDPSSPAASAFNEDPLANGSQDDAQSNTSSQPNVSPAKQVEVDDEVEMEVVDDAVVALSPPASPFLGDNDDPELARVEQKLHDTIDRALATYSEEVMAIKAARAQKKKAREGQSSSSL